MKRRTSRKICISFAFFCTCCYSHAQNLIVNGDFSTNNTGFTSQYTYKTAPATSQGQYFVGSNPHLWYSPHPSFFDHTLGTAAGSMLMFDGATVAAPNQLIAWAQTVPVVAGTAYTFDFWLANIGIANPAQLEVRINGVPQGGLISASGSGVWQFFDRTWNAGSATSATIEIRNLHTSATGNDFAIDDLRFAVAAPEPSPLALLTIPLALGFIYRRRG